MKKRLVIGVIAAVVLGAIVWFAVHEKAKAPTTPIPNSETGLSDASGGSSGGGM